jgi:hypothetical protein
LAEVRAQVEPNHRQQTEPDVVIRFPDVGWVFIEAKFGSGITTAGSDEKVTEWIDRYCPHPPDLFDSEVLGEVRYTEFPEQILRNLVFAELICPQDEQPVVVLLTREQESGPGKALVSRCLRKTARVHFLDASWEQIYRLLPEETPELAPLRDYLEGKSYRLARAFVL